MLKMRNENGVILIYERKSITVVESECVAWDNRTTEEVNINLRYVAHDEDPADRTNVLKHTQRILEFGGFLLKNLVTFTTTTIALDTDNLENFEILD